MIKSFKQISVFIENKPGRLATVTGILNDHKINIHAMSLADTADYGIVRMVVSDPDAVKALLRGNGLLVETTDVAAVLLKDEPGSLHNLLCKLAAEQISVEYMYAFSSHLKEHDAIVILRLADQENAVAKMQKLDIGMLNKLG